MLLLFKAVRKVLFVWSFFRLNIPVHPRAFQGTADSLTIPGLLLHMTLSSPVSGTHWGLQDWSKEHPHILSHLPPVAS